MTHVAEKLKRSLPEDSVCLLDRGLDHKPKAGRLRAIGQFAALAAPDIARIDFIDQRN